MKTLKRSRYYTMNSWNRSTSPAYNLKIYNVINKDLQDQAYELLDTDTLWTEINDLIAEFDHENNYEYQAGFNGRSGGYLVLYIGGKREDGTTYTQPGKSIDDEDVPVEVLKRFRKLAVNIVKETEYLAKNYKVETEKYLEEKERKVLKKK